MLMLAAIVLSLCPPGPHDNCVWDGDTFWLSGEKIRVADIDAPELDTPRGRPARDRLLQLLDAGPFIIRREGVDRYGRTLAVVERHGSSLGCELVREGLARPWIGPHGPRCR
jgi:endonuclease YncB( thermonuclease family)